MLLLTTLGAALACGGFACDQTVSQTTGELLLAQNGERILFVVNDDDTITTHVEVGFTAKERMDFSWIIPIPVPIDASSVQSQDATLFNALDAATPTRLETTYVWTDPTAGGGGGSGSSGCGTSGDSSLEDTGSAELGLAEEEQSTVEVTDEAVVGPFAIEVITATNVSDFSTWLTDNGYMLPEGGDAALDHYIQGGMAFLGVQLSPLATLGPIDTLTFTYPGTQPMIPIILTSIGAVEDMPITVWVAADRYHRPSNFDWMLLDTDQLRDYAVENGALDGFGYETAIQELADQHGGQGFVQQWATPIDWLEADPLVEGVLPADGTITRWTARISPDEMTLDPIFVFNAQDLQTNDGVVRVTINSEPPSGGTGGAWLMLLPLVALGGWRRREP